jgi:TRAP-type C4-dicarboxylate transport system substrate-binding protein
LNPISGPNGPIDQPNKEDAMIRTTTKIAALGLGATLALGAGTAAAANWDMPTPYGATNFHTVNIMKFAADVKKATGGKLVIKVHPGGSLIKHPEIKNAVRSGQVPIGEFLLSRLANENAVFQVDSIPFLASSYGAARKLWGASRGPIEKALAKQRLKVLYAVPWPPQGLYAKKNGRRSRCPTSPRPSPPAGSMR